MERIGTYLYASIEQAMPPTDLLPLLELTAHDMDTASQAISIPKYKQTPVTLYVFTTCWKGVVIERAARAPLLYHVLLGVI
jgi:hypothetical protein